MKTFLLTAVYDDSVDSEQVADTLMDAAESICPDVGDKEHECVLQVVTITSHRHGDDEFVACDFAIKKLNDE